MGAKAPEQVKKSNKTPKPRPPVKCDVCGRKFLNVSAWKSHYKFLHAKSDSDKRVAFKKQDNARVVRKKLVPLHLLKRVNPPKSQKAEKTVEPVKTTEVAVISQRVPKKAAFECPVCASKYPVYFTAFRHIQKNHCIDEKGEKVAPNSPHLVKPIRIETCASCDQEIRSTIPHDCPRMQAFKDQFLCLGCDQVFCGLMLFQHHIKGLHADEAQNFFFPSRKEFEEWKTKLQEAIKIEFTRLNKQKGKEIYHCSYQNTTTSTATRLCPASISVRDYSRGVHVCYFREHCGHKVEDVPLKHSNQYNISLYTRDTDHEKLEADDDIDLYKEFKNVLSSIMFDSAKVDVATLRDLLGRALEMTTVLKNYHGEGYSITSSHKSLSDDQISKSLSDSLQPKSKRKQNFAKKTENVAVKKVKKTPATVENGMTTRHNKSSTAVNQSVSSNKIVKQKAEKTTLSKELQELLEEESSNTPPMITEEPIKGVVVKTAESQSKELEVKKSEEPARSLIQSPTSFNDSYKHFVNQNFNTLPETSTPKPKTTVKKKEVVKTKIGQFKVKPISPKTVSPRSPKIVIKEEPIIPLPLKVKQEIKYVVKEQENDCNILILKI